MDLIPEKENYYVLIKICNNTDLDLVNNKVQVVGIFSSRENAEMKITNSIAQACNNLNPKYIIQGPFSLDRPSSNILRPNPIPHPDIFSPDIFKPENYSSKYFSSRYFPH